MKDGEGRQPDQVNSRLADPGGPNGHTRRTKVTTGGIATKIRSGSRLLMTPEAVFPFYIVQQTAIVLAGRSLRP